MTRWIILLLLSLLLSIFHTVMFATPLGDKLEHAALDLWFNLRGIRKPPSDFVIIAMDEESYTQLGVPLNQAWPRSIHADLLQRLKEMGAKRIVFDVLFLDAGPDKTADERLAQAFGSIPTTLGTEQGKKDMSSGTGSYTIDVLFQPYEPFAKKAASLGLVTLPEQFAHVRRFWTERSHITEDLPTLAEAGAGVDLENAELPDKYDFINFYGPPGTIRTFSYEQVLQTEVPLPLEKIKDKTVFVGILLRTEVGPSQMDAFLVPYYGEQGQKKRMFGVEIHATAAANIFSKDWINCAAKWLQALILGLVSFAIALLMFSIRPLWGLLVLVLSIICWAIIAYVLFLSGTFVPGVNLFLVTLPIAFLGSTLYYYVSTHRARKQIELAFEFYLSPEMAEQMAKNPNALQLGGESVYATALFTDIAGFTDITEKMTAQDVSMMLNAYFTEVMEVIFKNQGTLIKFIGDAVFALFGAPIKLPDHAKRAVETALAMQKEVERFNASKRFPALNTRIGLNTGPMVAGNLGSKRRFDYTAIGDSVNLASRVEGINKQFGTVVLITDATKKEMGEALKSFRLGEIRVVGKKEVVGLNTVFADPVPSEIEAQWLKALKDFKARRWDTAVEIFKSISTDESRLKKAAGLYLQEIGIHKTSPPEDDWDGEIIFRSK